MRILSALIVGVVAFGFSFGVGEWLLGILKIHAEKITADDILGIQYIMPFFFGACAFILVWKIMKR